MHLMFPWLLPERGSLVFTTGSSSTDSSSVSWDALSDMDSLFSLPRLTILRKEGRLEASASLSVHRFPQGRLSLRSSLRRPVKLQSPHSSNREHECHRTEQDTLSDRMICTKQHNRNDNYETLALYCSVLYGSVAAMFGMPHIHTSVKLL